MELDLEQIRDNIKEQNTLSKAQAEKYEAVECWSYAYLTRWIVLERGLKSLYDLHNRECIRTGASNWLNYLDGKIPKVPEIIKDFSVQTLTIPKPKFIKELLGNCNSIQTALDSNNKYRPKRNRIAHKAEEFSSEKYYLGYREVVDKAIKQLLTKLSQKINTDKKR